MIQYSEIDHKKQSFIITVLLFLLFFLLLFLLKFNSQTKVENLEGGGGGGEIEVNFGNSDIGSGENFESKEMAQPAPKSIEKEQIIKEELVTNVSENDAPEVFSVKKPKEEPKKTIEKPVEKPKPSKATTDAISNMLNESNSKTGDGNDGAIGNKGKTNGNIKASGYEGGGGTGTGSGKGSGQGIGTGSGYGAGIGSGTGSGNWKLAGRKLAQRSKEVQKCNEYGIVVVQVSVNRNGNVIATKYSKGTTNTNPCLLEPAYATAKSYKWQPDQNAPETQVGFITINFKSSE